MMVKTKCIAAALIAAVMLIAMTAAYCAGQMTSYTAHYLMPGGISHDVISFKAWDGQRAWAIAREKTPEGATLVYLMEGVWPPFPTKNVEENNTTRGSESQ